MLLACFTTWMIWLCVDLVVKCVQFSELVGLDKSLEAASNVFLFDKFCFSFSLTNNYLLISMEYMFCAYA